MRKVPSGKASSAIVPWSFFSPLPVKPEPWKTNDRPRPRRTVGRLDGWTVDAALSAASNTSSEPTLSVSFWPVAVVSPTRNIHLRRRSTLDIPSRSATCSTISSAANSDWGAPKPRNAPLGGVFVATARAWMGTLGQEYGPAAWIVARDHTAGVSGP